MTTRHGWPMRVRVLVLTWLAATMAVSTAGARPVSVPKTEQFYVVAAHPDDEPAGWPYLEQLPKTTYVVFVLLTRGEATDSCQRIERAHNIPGTEAVPPTDLGNFLYRLNIGAPTAVGEDSSGPYKYEGPGSPVGEPNKGERHPLGYPWVGQRTEACAQARIASWHWFLDEQSRVDGVGTDLAVENDPEKDDDYQGRFCPRMDHEKSDGRRRSDGSPGCSQVWANESGARVVFDLGDQGYTDGTGFLPSRFTSDQVTEALQSVRLNRGGWGIPELDEAGVLASTRYGDGTHCDLGGGGSDHDIVNQAIRYQDQGLPVQAGVMGCSNDQLAVGADVRALVHSPTSLVGWNLIVPPTGQRLGPALVNYGWLFEDYEFMGCPVPVCYIWEVKR